MGARRIGQIVIIKANNFVHSDSLACVRDTSDLENKILLEFCPPITVGNGTYSHAVILPRLEKDGVETLFRGNALGSAVTWVPVSLFNPRKPFDISWWRGGAAAITDALLV